MADEDNMVGLIGDLFKDASNYSLNKSKLEMLDKQNQQAIILKNEAQAKKDNFTLTESSLNLQDVVINHMSGVSSNLNTLNREVRKIHDDGLVKGALDLEDFAREFNRSPEKYARRDDKGNFIYSEEYNNILAHNSNPANANNQITGIPPTDLIYEPNYMAIAMSGSKNVVGGKQYGWLDEAKIEGLIKEQITSKKTSGIKKDKLKESQDELNYNMGIKAIQNRIDQKEDLLDTSGKEGGNKDYLLAGGKINDGLIKIWSK